MNKNLINEEVKQTGDEFSKAPYWPGASTIVKLQSSNANVQIEVKLPDEKISQKIK